MMLEHDQRTSASSGYAPDYLSTLSTRDLQDLFRETRSLPLDALLNRGTVTVDYEARRVWRDSFWKGSFAKDTLLGWEERIATPIRKLGPGFAGGRFWKRFDEIRGDEAVGHVVNYGVTFLPGRPRVQHLRYPDDKRRYVRAGDEVLRLSYVNHPYRTVYDLIKIVDANNCVGVMHLGTFPRGFEFATFVMARNNYPFEKMAVPDHDAIMNGDHTRVPAPAELAGSWKGHVVFLGHPDLALHNQFNPPLLRFDFTGNGGTAWGRIGPLSSDYRLQFDADGVRLLNGSTSHLIRMIDADTLIGRRLRSSSPDATPNLRYVLTRRPAIGSDQTSRR